MGLRSGLRSDGYGRVTFDSPELADAGNRDPHVDARATAAVTNKKQYGIKSLQLTLGTATWPRTQIAEQDPKDSRMAFLWHYYLDYNYE